MKATLKPTHEIKVELDGKPVQGVFLLKGEWNGMLELECTGPCARIIVIKPAPPQNAWDFISHIFGGGQRPEKLAQVEVEVVQQDVFRPTKQKPD